MNMIIVTKLLGGGINNDIRKGAAMVVGGSIIICLCYVGRGRDRRLAATSCELCFVERD